MPEITQEQLDAFNANATKLTDAQTEIAGLKTAVADTTDVDKLQSQIDALTASASGDKNAFYKNEMDKATAKRDASKALYEQEIATKQAEIDGFKIANTTRDKQGELTKALRNAGVSDDSMNLALPQFDLSKFDLDESGKLTGIDDQVKELVEKYPTLVTAKSTGSHRAGGGNNDVKLTNENGDFNLNDILDMSLEALSTNK